MSIYQDGHQECHDGCQDDQDGLSDGKGGCEDGHYNPHKGWDCHHYHQVGHDCCRRVKMV